jgi:hypothetical protein
VEVAMFEFEIDVSQPGLDGTRILEDILLVDGIFFGLWYCQRLIPSNGVHAGVCFTYNKIKLWFP